MKKAASEVAKLNDDEIRALLEPGETPTLKTISRISGLAIPTVSRALGDAPDIGGKTKDLINYIADSIGYVPNRAGVRLRTGRTNVISLVVPAADDVLNSSARLMSSIAQELRATRFHLNVMPWFADENPLRPIKYIVETRSADAVIFNATEPEDPRVTYLLKNKFPFATHGRTKWADQHAYFEYDNAAFMRVAIRQLARRGRKNLLAILPPLNQNYAQDMMRGLEEESVLSGVNFRVSKNVHADQPSSDIRHWVTQRLQKSPELDAVICSSTKAAIAAIVAIEDQGRTLGQDIDIMSKEVAPILQMFRESALVKVDDVGEAGKFLAKAVLRQLREPDASLMQRVETPTDTSL